MVACRGDPSVSDFLRSVGDELRHARQEAGFALRDLNVKSGREFKASAVGGYERGERSISLERFCRLAALYGLEPDELLRRVVGRSSEAAAPSDVVIDIRSGQPVEPAAAGPRPVGILPGAVQPTT